MSKLDVNDVITIIAIIFILGILVSCSDKIRCSASEECIKEKTDRIYRSYTDSREDIW